MSPMVQALFKWLLLHWVLGQVSLCVNPLKCPLVLLGVTDFQSQTFWRLVSLVSDPRVGVPVIRYKPLAPQGKGLYFQISPVVVEPGRQDHDSASPTRLHVALLFFVVEVLFIQILGLFSEKIIPYVAINLMCPREEVCSGSCYTAVLNYLPSHPLPFFFAIVNRII